MMKIQYDNLTIRQADVADAKQLTAWWNDGAVMAHAGFPNSLGTTEEEVIERLGNGRMVIEESDRLIGECNYRNVSDGAAEIGIKICETYCQNRSVGRKVLSMLRLNFLELRKQMNGEQYIDKAYNLQDAMETQRILQEKNIQFLLEPVPEYGRYNECKVSVNTDKE